MTSHDGTPRDQRSSPATDPTLAVLLIEDHAAVARLIQEFLWDHATLRVTWVQTLAAAFAHLRETAVDLALLDLGLPDSWGLETVTRLVQRHPALPVIVLTARDEDDGLADAALRAGAEEYLSKRTLEPGRLARAIWDAWERKRR
jgi:two-component system, cell cycle sensor histidine kinase and response regulator CckA